MKKLCLVLVFFALLGALAGGTEGHEEIDFLLFLPNSGNQFVNENQAMIQLDNLAKYLADRVLMPGQIIVYGYTAEAVNDIEPIDLSRDRALFVINELQKRGISKEYFSAPVAYGSVDLWGANTSEEDRIPNRRVRILLDGGFLTPDSIKAVEPASKDEKAIGSEDAARESSSGIPWKILLPLLFLALIAALIFLLFRRGKEQVEKTAQEESQPQATAAPVKYTVVNLEDEIRRRAYELYMERNGQNGSEAGDWYIAVPEIRARYESEGYETYTEEGTWYARRYA